MGNPNDFIKMVSSCIETELAHVLIDGIQYEAIGGSIYELRELQADGLDEKDRFIDQLYEVKNTEKPILTTLCWTPRWSDSSPSIWMDGRTSNCL